MVCEKRFMFGSVVAKVFFFILLLQTCLDGDFEKLVYIGTWYLLNNTQLKYSYIFNNLKLKNLID